MTNEEAREILIDFHTNREIKFDTDPNYSYNELLTQAIDVAIRALGDGFIPVQVVQDESSHWYVIPSSLMPEWSAHEQDISNQDEYSDEWYEAIERFSQKFTQYRTGGDINNTQLYIPSPPKPKP